MNDFRIKWRLTAHQATVGSISMTAAAMSLAHKSRKIQHNLLKQAETILYQQGKP